VYVSNHASYFDIPAIVAGIPDQIRIIYKKELEMIPIFGWGLKFGKTYIGIDRGNGPKAVKSLEEAVRKIRNGASVILFGEGTRTSDGNLQPFKRGPFNLAMRAGVSVVPVTLIGTYKVFSRHSWRITPGPVTLILSEPIPIPEQSGRDSELALRDRVHDVIAETLERYKG
jgi:1-acyl-sn-glycerol-3-phosphate acyltransferase